MPSNKLKSKSKNFSARIVKKSGSGNSVPLNNNTKLRQYQSKYWHKPFIINKATDHSMGKPLMRYLKMKIHQLVEEGWYKNILVVGEYDRSCSIGNCEKHGKLTNWQRPTAEIIGDTLLIKCFPGSDYVRHYASIIASYLAMIGKDPSLVSYILPDDSEAWEAVHSIGMGVLPKGDFAIFGHGLFEIADKDCLWQANDLMAWTSQKIGNKDVTFIIFQFSFWGDIVGRITSQLATEGFKGSVFTAKVGGIAQELIPNYHLATGGLTYIEGEIVQWDNIFSKSRKSNLKHGTHINSPCVIFEDKTWVKLFKNYDFVDSEIGHFARAAKEANMSFGYLHFISNSLSKPHKEDLSNERLKKIIKKRENLKKDVREILHNTFSKL